MSKSDLAIVTDENGKRYVEIVRGLPSKNVKGSTDKNAYFDNKQSKMCEISENESRCPVVALSLYLEKLPKDSNNLFPRPLDRYFGNNWYSAKSVRGKDYMGNLMKRLSEKLKLSQSLTNHSIRSTVVSNLMDMGYDTTSICAVTGHKSVETLRKYASYKNDIQRLKNTRQLCLNLSMDHHLQKPLALSKRLHKYLRPIILQTLMSQCPQHSKSIRFLQTVAEFTSGLSTFIQKNKSTFLIILNCNSKMVII